MPTLPHFDWPFRLGVTVEQDTARELAASAAVILCTPLGQRDDEPAFGVTTPLFESIPVDEQALAAQVAQSDPRLADIRIEDLTQLADATVARLHIDLPGE